MNSLQRLTGATAVIVVSGLTLAGIVLIAALITDAVSTRNEGGNFPDRMARIFGTDSADPNDEDAWDSEAWRAEIEEMKFDYSLPGFYLYREGDDLKFECVVDPDPDIRDSIHGGLVRVTGSDLSSDDDLILVSCPDAAIYIDDGDPDRDVSPSDDVIPAGRLPRSAEDLLETFLGRFTDGDEDLFEFEFADQDDAWSKRDFNRQRSFDPWAEEQFGFKYGEPDNDEEYTYGFFTDDEWDGPDGDYDKWWTGDPFTFEEGRPSFGDTYTFQFFGYDARDESDGAGERYGFDERLFGGPFTFRYSGPGDDEEYTFEFFDSERWINPDEWADRYSDDKEWADHPFFSFRYRDETDNDDRRRFPFGMFRFDSDDAWGEADEDEYAFDEYYDAWGDELDDLFNEDGGYSFGEDLTPEQEELLRQMMQRMMEMFGFDDTFPFDRFDYDDWDPDGDNHHGDDDDDGDGTFWFRDSDGTTVPARY